MVKKILGAITILVVLSGIPSPGLGKFILVIDAGHGGHDAGAIGTYSQEKNINLNVALAFGSLVENNCKDVKVIYTRKTDVFIPLQERASIANRNKADLFISIHTNALPGGKIATGSETYALGMARSAENLNVAKRENSVILIENDYKEKYAGFDPSSSESYIIFEFMQDQHIKQSISLARSIQRYYVQEASRPDKGVHQAGFLVLRETSMPSVLTELGFITTPEEEAFLNSSDGIQKLSRAIYDGFLEYKDGVKTKPLQREEAIEDLRPVVDTVPAEKENVQFKYSEKDAKNTTPSIITGKTAGSTVAEKITPATSAERKKSQTSSKASASGVSKEKSLQGKSEKSTKVSKHFVEYRIQFLTSTTVLKKDDPRISSYENVSYYQDVKGGLFKYTCSPRNKYRDALLAQKQIRKQIPGAFVVAFCGGKRIDLQEAREKEENKYSLPDKRK